MHKHTHDIAWISGIVYFSQGALGISGIALPLFLRSIPWSVAKITSLMSIAAFPWICKIVYGLISDTFPICGYRRKSYLVFYLCLAATGWLGLAFLPATTYWIMISLLVANLGFAATDVIMDGIVVEHSTQVTSSIYQSIAWGSRSFGSVLGGILGGWLAAHCPARQVFLMTMVLPLSVTFWVLKIHEKEMKRAPFNSAVMPIKRCVQLLGTPNLRYFMVLLILVSLSASFGIPFFFFMKETLGFHETFLGLLSSLGWFGAMLGSLLYLLWLRRLPPKLTLRWAILINSLNILSTLLISNERSAFIIVLVGGFMGCLVMLPMMSAAAILSHHTGIESGLFAVFMSIFNLGQIVFGFAGGRLFSILGLYPLILLTGLLGLVGLFFVDKLRLETVR